MRIPGKGEEQVPLNVGLRIWEQLPSLFLAWLWVFSTQNTAALKSGTQEMMSGRISTAPAYF